MIEIEMGVAGCVDEFARLQSCHLSHHLQQQSVRSDVEWHAEEGVGRALVELQRQAAVGNVKLEEAVAGRQCHLFYLSRVPCCHHHSA